MDGLNPGQKEAVLYIDSPCLVLAGAGSGKTRVITQKIAYLIQECGIKPVHIAAVTFTNKAAKEMRQRLESLLGDHPRGLSMGTFHATCVRILRRDVGHLGLSRGFVIYDDSDSLGVVKECLKRHDLDPKVVAHPLHHEVDQVSGRRRPVIEPRRCGHDQGAPPAELGQVFQVVGGHGCLPL